MTAPTGGIATPDLRCFHDHRRGRRPRHQVRSRQDPTRELASLEIKTRPADIIGPRRVAIVILGLLVAASCGSETESSDLCEGRPCLTRIEDAADWAAVSDAHGGERCDFAAETKFLMPATAHAALQDTVFQDVKTHRFHLLFMTGELPEYFGGLTPAAYGALVHRRASRQYWTGALFELRDAAGASLGYGFDVAVDPTSPYEQLTEAEVEAIGDRLRERFGLPLVYAPIAEPAVQRALDFTRVTTHFPRACDVVPCADGDTDCIVVPAATTVCGHFVEFRSLADELARKAQLAMIPGTYNLPRTLGQHTIPALFGAGELGPQRTPITLAQSTGTYTVELESGFEVRTYRQRFQAGAEMLALSWRLFFPEGGGGIVVAEPQLSSMRFRVEVDDAQTSAQQINLSSCDGQGLDRWRVLGTLAGGDSFAIDVRYRPPFAGSGPLLPTRAQVTLGGQIAVVDDYYRLVYAGEHHNWNNQYWVLFDSPIDHAGHPIHGLWVDEEPYQMKLEAAWTLDAQRQPLDQLTVHSYSFTEVP